MRFTIVLGLLLINPVKLFAKNTPETDFWNFFTQIQDRFENFEGNQEELMGDLGTALESYREGLVFEISAKKNGVREFVVSADGISSLFSAVSKLTGSAPNFENWQITAFRPRLDDYSRFSVEYGGRTFAPTEIWFYSRVVDGHFDVIFYHPSYRDEDRSLIISGTYILLDMALGEYDVVTGINQLDHQLLPPDPMGEQLRPFSEFRAAFHEFKKQSR